MANSIDIILPNLGWNYNRLEVELTLPEADFGYVGGGSISVLLPQLVPSIGTVAGELGQIDVILGWPQLQTNNGRLTFELFGAGNISASLPSLTVDVDTQVGGVYSLNIVLPLVTALVNSQFENVIGSIDVELPQFTFSNVWYQRITGSISGAIPMLRYNVNTLVGSVGEVDVDLPLFEYSGTMFENGIGVLDVTLPVLIVDKYGISTPTTISYKAIIMNTKNFSVSEYPDYQFNSMVNFRGKTLAAKGSNIHLMGANTDSGIDIDMTVGTGNLNFSNPVVMLPRDVWLTLKSGKKVKMRALEAEKSDDYIYDYDSSDFEDKSRNTRVKLGRGLRGPTVRFEVDNVDGESLEIERIHILSSPLPGRKRG